MDMPAPFEISETSNMADRACKRVGVVDVGSNSVRFVVFDGTTRSPAYFYNEKVLCGLGAGLRDTKRLNPEGRVRALAALKRFQAIGESMGITPLSTVATAAVREAEDGPEFCEQVQRDIGMTLQVIDGEEEARLSAQGVLLGWPEGEGLICDIGGASMEMAKIGDGKVGSRFTSDLGPLHLQSLPGGRKAQKKHIRTTVEQLYDQLGSPKGSRLFLVGGSWRAIAKIDMDRRGYPLHVLHEYRMTARDVRYTADTISHSNHASLRDRCGISSTRMDLVPLASQVLRDLVKVTNPKEIIVSSYGIREGVLYEQMPMDLRICDPLIETAIFMENKDARMPGFGTVLFEFIKPIFAKATPKQLRLIEVACLLHDVSWRAHPDFRSEVCFEMATRANLSGLTHDERVQLGLALMHRYSRKGPSERFSPFLPLLTEKQISTSEILGKAMRLGAMLWNQPGSQPATLSWRNGRKTLQLTLSDAAKPLYGEVAEARFKSLCSTLRTSPKVV